MDGRQWLVDHPERLAGLRARAERVQAELAAVRGTATSPDGAVEVAVAPGGALVGLQLGPRADGLSRTQLATLVVATAAAAARDAAGRVEEITMPLLDPGAGR